MAIDFLCAVLVLASNPEASLAFYRDALGVPLEPSSHAAGHYECELGDLHFAILPRPSSDQKSVQISAVRIAFAVRSLPEAVAQLIQRGVHVDPTPLRRGFGTMTTVRDPDGNEVVLTQLSPPWLKYLESRGVTKRDIVAALKAKGDDGEDP